MNNCESQFDNNSTHIKPNHIGNYKTNYVIVINLKEAG